MKKEKINVRNIREEGNELNKKLRFLRNAGYHTPDDTTKNILDLMSVFLSLPHHVQLRYH